MNSTNSSENAVDNKPKSKVSTGMVIGIAFIGAALIGGMYIILLLM